MSTSRAQQIAQQNDAFRTALGKHPALPGQVVATQGVAHRQDQGVIIQKVREFNDFNEENDPHGEHDFGSFEIGDDQFFWKIDYYDSKECEYGAADALNSYRVLTIMLAEEY